MPRAQGTKAMQVRRLPRYLAASALAGAYVGVAVVLLASVAGPFVAANAPAGKLVHTGTQLFWRSVLCNALVCLALWMRDGPAVTPPIWWCCGGRSWRSSHRVSSTLSPT